MFKKILIVVGGLLLLLIVGFVALKAFGDAHYFTDYDAKLPLKAEVTDVKTIQDHIKLFDVDRPREYRRTALSIEARPGDRVPCILTEPLEAKGKLPTIVFLHGSGQKKDFVEEICSPFNKAGFAMLSFDQYSCGERKLQGGGWKKATAWYSRGWRTVNDTRRIIDYLDTREDIDPDRIYLVGASYGAMTGTHVLALDKRIKAGVLVVGGGDFHVMLDAPLIRANVPGAVLAMLKPMARYLGGPFDPVVSAPHTGPTPILMQNGSADTLVWPDAGKALFAALSEPKEIRWYDTDHPGLRKGDGPEIVHMLDDGLKWLEEQDAKQHPNATKSAAAPVVKSGTPTT